ncbi:MAG: pyrroline-5-carboxylate reductase [Rickettsiales bacterium]|nr:pyrroline-5-carboxylate reductase [Rickettsiales bacterium]
MTDRSLLLVGCGRMGSALLTRWKKSATIGIQDFWVIEPNAPTMRGMKSRWVSDLEFVPTSLRPHVIVFAVKPQQLSTMLPAFKKRFGSKPLYISIAAGKPLSFFHSHLGRDAHIVRVMPNTPALIGKGMSVLCASKALPSIAKKTATNLLAAVGQTSWIENEQWMDAVTAVSGSGPAYVFLFLDALTQAGIEHGLPEAMAKQLAIATLIGSGELARASTDSLDALRQQVTSPGGTTEAGLRVLMEKNGLKSLVQEAVKKAAERSKELSK